MKSPAQGSARKPPVPAASHADIDAWIPRLMPAVQPLVKRLDALICEAIPGLHYAIKWSKAYYGLPEHGWIIELAAYHVSVNLVFFGGARFDPPPPLGEGSRYVKLRTLAETEQPELRQWIAQAARVPGWQ